MILDEIIESKQREIEEAKKKLPLEQIQKSLIRSKPPHFFFNQLKDSSRKPALIAELKRKSPSKGIIRKEFNPSDLALELESAGASALSVLTDEPFFGGCLEFLTDVNRVSTLPILRKDFMLDYYQIYEAAAYKADAVLLIAQLLSVSQLLEFLKLSNELGLDAVIEIHNEEELEKVLKINPEIIGVNQRNLSDFSMHPENTKNLIPKIPKGKFIIAESGLSSKKDILMMKEMGINAVLIGESLMSAPSAGEKAKELFDGI